MEEEEYIVWWSLISGTKKANLKVHMHEIFIVCF